MGSSIRTNAEISSVLRILIIPHGAIHQGAESSFRYENKAFERQ